MTLILKQSLSVIADDKSSALPVVMELHDDRFVSRSAATSRDSAPTWRSTPRSPT
jgi:hypothetical protein